MGKIFTLWILLIIPGMLTACKKENRDQGPETQYPEEVFIENDVIKLGINTKKGGAITCLARKDDGINLINNYDLGRQVQISFYAYPVPYIPSEDKQPHPSWVGIGWNPIQAGDVAGNGSRILDLWYEGDSLYVRCIPMHWPLDNVPGECEYESRIKLEGNKVFANARIINKRPDKTQYPARSNEFPAVYTNGTHYRLYSYTGAKPFTMDETTLIPKRDVDPGEFPWNRFYATESWAALVDENMNGLGVYSPVTDLFLGGFVGQEGAGGTNDAPTGYISPIGMEILDHNIEFDYDYVLITGSIEEIRSQVYEMADRRRNPAYIFSGDRQHWYYENFHDDGWPIGENLRITPNQSSASLIGPEVTFYAENNRTLVVHAAFQTGTNSMTFLWRRLGDENFDAAERGAPVAIINDGEFHDYRIDLGDHPNYNDLITSIRLNFNGLNANQDWIKLSSVHFE